MRVKAVAFDLFETTFQLEPLREHLGGDLDLWFTRTLRDGFALEAAGTWRPFREVAEGTLRQLFAERGLRMQPDAVLSRFTALPAWPDAREAFQTLHDAGVRVVSLSNGALQVARALLEKAGLVTEAQFATETVQHWKPRAEVYLQVPRALGLAPHDVALVAVHGWDVHGAMRAGLRGAWVSRREKLFSPAYGAPDLSAATLADVARQLVDQARG